MSPERRTNTPLGPLTRGRFGKARRLASVALLVTAGLVTPAAAVAATMTTHGSATNADDPKCDPDKSGHRPDGDECPTPTSTSTTLRPPPSTNVACSDIGAQEVPGPYDIRAALTGGRYYAGIRTTTNPVFLWTDLSTRTNYPNSATTGFPCAASITQPNAGQRIKLDLITTTGSVYEILCDETPNNIPTGLTCDPSWTLQNSPTPNANNS